MAGFYDKEKFTGGRGAANSNPAGGQPPPSGGGQPPPYQTPPPRRPYQAPPVQRSKNSGWYSWPVIILLFALGIWPIALALLFLNLFSEKKTTPSSSGGAAGSRARTYDAQAQSAVERAMRKAEERMDKAEHKVDQAFGQAEKSVDQAVERAMAQMERTISHTAMQVRQTAKADWKQPAPPPPQVKQAKPKKEKRLKTKPAGVLLRVLGIIFLAVGGIGSLEYLADFLQGSYLDLEDLFASLGFLFSGGLMFFRGHYLNKMSRRSQRYILAIGNNDAMPIDEIAKRVNRKPNQAKKELQKLIDKGYLGEDAYIDQEKGYFLRFGATLEEEPVEEPVFQSEPDMTPKEAEEGYSGILRNIRRANDRIADPELSRKIDRLEQISSLIFKEVEEHPEKRNSIHTFFDYYLPTTQKLLDTYADFEETGVEGENLRQAKARIEQTMDMIVDGFEHQLDQLYSSDAMDVVSDIKVMEAMLKRDTASAAKDFGYEAPPMVRPKSDAKKDEGGQMQTMR